MPPSWRWKSILTLGLVVLSVYFLTPTLGRFEESREKLEKNPSASLPFYFKLFPKEEIKLGLDLKGGIYVEMEVQFVEALRNRSDLISTELEKLLQKESFVPEKIERLADTTEIQILLKKEEDREALNRWVKSQYPSILFELKQKGEGLKIFLDLTEDYAEQTKKLSVRQALETIRNRIDRFGVAEPTIVQLGQEKISIELPGMTDPERALNLIQRSGKLEFRLLDETMPEAVVRQSVTEAREKFSPDDFTDEAVRKINETLKDKLPKDSEILFEIQDDPVTKKIVGGVPYLVKRKAEITGEMLKNAQVNVQNNEPYVSLSFNPLGSKLFADLTKAHVGKRLAIILDGNVSAAPVIREPILSGEAQITLGLGDYQSLLREAEDLTLVLREGALPARLKELIKTVVGASLGEESIRQGVRVTLLSGLLVMIFMIFYYRLSGFLADVALLLNVLFILAALAIFQATLTLPGIAGIVLTIGMAVDANVLIFERMREELRGGRSARNALEAGYKNAMSAILDSNITTFLAGIVLYQFGTGPIRGFAVTLMIGIITTLFTAIIVTRVLQDGILYGLKKEGLSV